MDGHIYDICNVCKVIQSIQPLQTCLPNHLFGLQKGNHKYCITIRTEYIRKTQISLIQHILNPPYK